MENLNDVIQFSVENVQPENEVKIFVLCKDGSIWSRFISDKLWKCVNKADVKNTLIQLNNNGQFTSLYDKNGREICCGDRFKANSPFIYEVLFERGAFGYKMAGDDEMFKSFAENFANLKGRGNKLNAVEVVD